LGWPVTGSQAGRLYLRVGFRSCGLIGSTFVVLGAALLLLLGSSSSVLQVALTCFLIGLGMGLCASPTLIAAQSSVGWKDRGVVTGNNMFCRSLGSALGVAIFGAIANTTLGSSAAVSPGTAPSGGSVSRAGLTSATQHVFLGVLIVAIGMAVAIACMPRGLPGAEAAPAQPVDPAGASDAANSAI
ncbi:MAG: transport protein, partial [Frankiales bacterium]|nr:transport protein [Frankiales bacterium]